MKCFLSKIAILAFFFNGNLIRATDIPIAEMPNIVAEQFLPFIQTKEIRSFLQSSMKIDLANGGVKVFGSTVFALEHPDIKPGDIDLIAISPLPRGNIIRTLFNQSCVESSWKLDKVKNRTFVNCYGKYTGAHASFINKTSGISIDILFLEQKDFFTKHDPVFVASAKVLEYFEKTADQEPYFKTNYIRAEEFGGVENIEFQIQRKILHIPRYHGNEAIFFRMVYTMFKHGFTLANRLTLERALFFLYKSNRPFANLKLLSDQKARESGDPVKYYSLMSSLLEHSYLAGSLEEAFGLKGFYGPTLKGLGAKNLEDMKIFFFHFEPSESHMLPELMREEKAYSFYFLKKYQALNQQKYKDPIYLTAKDFFADSTNRGLPAFINLNKIPSITDRSKGVFPNASWVEIKSANELSGLAQLRLSTGSGSIRFALDLKKEKAELSIVGTKYTLKTKKLKIAVVPDIKKSGQLLLKDMEGFLLPQHEIKCFTGPLSFLLEEQEGVIPVPQSIHDFLKSYGLSTFKLDALADLEKIKTQNLLNDEFCTTLLKSLDTWVKNYKKKLKRQKQKQKKKSPSDIIVKQKEEEPILAVVDPDTPYQEYINKWHKPVSKSRKVLIEELKEYSKDLLALMAIKETTKGIEIAHAAEERYRQFSQQPLIRKSSKKRKPGQDDLLINFLYFKSSFFLVLFHLQNHVEEEQEILNQYTLKTANFLIYGEDNVSAENTHAALKVMDEAIDTHLERKKLTRIPGGRRLFGFLVIRKVFNGMISHFKDAQEYNSPYITIYNQFIRELFPYYLEIFSQINREPINLRLSLGADELDAPLQTILNQNHHSLNHIFDAYFFKEIFDMLLLYFKTTGVPPYAGLQSNFIQYFNTDFSTALNLMLKHLSQEEVCKSLAQLFCMSALFKGEVLSVLKQIASALLTTPGAYQQMLKTGKEVEPKMVGSIQSGINLLISSGLATVPAGE